MSDILTQQRLLQVLASLKALVTEYECEHNRVDDFYKAEFDALHGVRQQNCDELGQGSAKELEDLDKKFRERYRSLEHHHRTALQGFQNENALKQQEVQQKHSGLREYERVEAKQRRLLIQQEAHAEEQRIDELYEANLAEINSLEKALQQQQKFASKLGVNSAELADNSLADLDFEQAFLQSSEHLSQGCEIQKSLQSKVLTRFFCACHPALILLVVCGVHGALYPLKGILGLEEQYILVSAVAFALVLAVMMFLQRQGNSMQLQKFAAEISQVESSLPLLHELLEQEKVQQVSQFEEQFRNDCQEHEAALVELIKQQDLLEQSALAELDAELQAVRNAQEDELAVVTEALAIEQQKHLQDFEDVASNQAAETQGEFNTQNEILMKARQGELDSFVEGWQVRWESALDDFDVLVCKNREQEQQLFPSWNADWKQFSLPQVFEPAVLFGHLHMDLRKELQLEPGSVLELPEPVPFSVPALLQLPENASLLVQTTDKQREQGLELIRNTVLRLLVSLPPGKCHFNFIDPLSLGENFSGFMYLSDYKEELTGARISTSPRQIEQQLSALSEHLETVIQKYLRNEFTDICAYNDVVGEIAEPFRFLVVADFPLNFSEQAVHALLSVAKSGARCGVYVLVHRDVRHKLPGSFEIGDIEQHCIVMNEGESSLEWQGSEFNSVQLSLEAAPEASVMNELVHRVGKSSILASRVEIPFARLRPKQDFSCNSSEELRVAIGLSGGRQQEMLLGHGTSQHVLLAGKTGSGKSNLIHVFICNLALNYSPQELEFYLIDFKKGVEFKPYAQYAFPHAKAVAIESDREFGLSILRKIDEEMQVRGEKLRACGVQNINQFRKMNEESLPRLMLVIDEFQELFTEDDSIAQSASLLLDRLVRQGRAFGIHIILGSQTLSGSYTLPRATMGQMAVRICLMCSEADSYAILSENNSAGRLLTRPGEAIYNDHAGQLEGNTPFQVAYLSEAEKEDLLKGLSQSFPDAEPPFVFEGNIPADPLRCTSLFEATNAVETSSLKLYLGEPNAVAPHLSFDLEPLSAANLLLIGNREESTRALWMLNLAGFAQQVSPGNLSVRFFDGNAGMSGSSQDLHELKEMLPYECEFLKPSDCEASLDLAWQELQLLRENPQPNKRSVLIFHGFHRFRKLRHEDSFSWDDAEKSPAAKLLEILSEGSEFGMHVLMWCDSWNSFSRALPRKALTEFNWRMLYQLSQNDSINLIDAADASKLDLHTALLFNDCSGETQKFRPFALPEGAWMEKAQKALAISSKV